ncbi:SMP-30/gluconolactonase/LRE family protein [Achromobacter xylosoxidans]|uniref:Gluconolactonase n=1 Tax=Alcaligenes xylosoxydans xylosoxydans TaxID=85698 RepID=A0A1R1JWH1_ALCXX|nr:SMP-30/gluconolactonase/LRE family protein [Achromobacter xylosoxidans]OMG90285.1 gluconolactonase [Achromobacter xylosoxidans]BEG73738.1 Gluconolactonase [Achromobacter xylosoxidans]
MDHSPLTQAGRRRLLGAALALAPAGLAQAQSFAFTPQQRYPDPSVRILDPEFARYRIYSSSVEQLATGFRWLEGPVWVGDGRYLLCSDIPNDRIIRWDETTGATSVFRQPANFSNGLARDRQGRLLACEHLTRRVTRTEYDGGITVLADRYAGKRFNSPNDIVCQRNGAIWFTDPPFGIGGHWEGDKAEPELPHSVYRIDAASGRVELALDDLAGPNGLCFSPDERVLYIVESRHQPARVVWAYDVGADGKLSGKRKFIDAQGPGAIDGIKCDEHGNLWCGWGSNGAADAKPEELDGVMVFNPGGKPIGHIRLPERCANLCFGGAKRNRLFMASSHSLYALYVETRGAI